MWKNIQSITEPQNAHINSYRWEKTYLCCMWKNIHFFTKPKKAPSNSYLDEYKNLYMIYKINNLAMENLFQYEILHVKLQMGDGMRLYLPNSLWVEPSFISVYMWVSERFMSKFTRR